MPWPWKRRNRCRSRVRWRRCSWRNSLEVEACDAGLPVPVFGGLGGKLRNFYTGARYFGTWNRGDARIGLGRAGRERPQVSDDLPALLFGERGPLRHALVGVAVSQHPGEFAVGGVANARAAQAGARRRVGAAIGVGAVAFGAVFLEERVAGGLGLGLMSVGVV